MQTHPAAVRVGFELATDGMFLPTSTRHSEDRGKTILPRHAEHHRASDQGIAGVHTT